jgi:hypothetical protein
MARQEGQQLQGLPFWGFSQLTALANIFALLVLPVPREPVNKYAWLSRPEDTWVFKVCVTAS